MYYVVTPIPYASGEPHLGHLLEALYSDTMVRYKRRLLSKSVNFSMGLDQHGLKIYQKALELDLKPIEYIHLQSQKFKNLWLALEISHDIFTETTSEKHKLIATLVWQKLDSKGLIYKKTYTGLYCLGCEAFYSKGQLDEQGQCPIHLTKPIEMTEENYFFKLSKFQDTIENYLKIGDIRPEGARLEWLNFTKEGLEDVSISREKKNLPWGIKIPGDPNQVMYVWFEALINYLTGLVHEDTLDKYLEFPHLREEFEAEVWEDLKEGLPINFEYMGKDISRFHLVLFPAMLSGLDLPFTETTLVHGFINDSTGRKMSKSLQNGTSPQLLLDLFGKEGTRFIVVHEFNTFEDTNFDLEAATQSFNANLANNLGNLVMRIGNLVEKYLDGLIEEDPKNRDELGVDLKEVYSHLENFQTQLSLKALFVEISKINQYLESKKPWELAKDLKTNLPEINRVLSIATLDLREIAKTLSIFLPETGDKIYQILSSDRIVKSDILFQRIDTK